MTCNETSKQIPNSEENFTKHDKDDRMFENFENAENPNLGETLTTNLGDSELVMQTTISVHLTLSQIKELINLLRHYTDVSQGIMMIYWV